ncbi:MAG TPA: HAMP domain-containing protein, partial [Anaeromyxobacter sp.]
GIGTLFPLVLVGAASLYWMRALDDRLVAGKLAAASAVATHVDEELTGDLEILQRLGGAVATALEEGDAAVERRLLREAQHQLRQREPIFLLDAAGRVAAEEPQGPFSEAPRADDPLVVDAIATGRPRLSGLVLGERGALVHELVPIRNWRGEVIGVVGGTFHPERRGFERMLRFLRSGEAGFAEIVDASGRVVVSTVPGRAGNPSECARRFGRLAQEKRTFATRCIVCHQEEGAAPGQDEHVAFAALAAAPWSVVVRQGPGDALPADAALPWYSVLGILAVHIALTAALAWGAARSVTRPVGVLTAAAEQIASGALDRPIPHLGEDEVGRLGKSLERMRQNLRRLIGEIEEANAKLEVRVAERTRELNDANERLREREEARAELLRKVISAQEDERKRIARELHDETSQGLAVLAMGLEAAQDAIRGGKTPRLDEVKAVAVRTLEDVHRLILDLRPSVLDDLGLLSAIRWYADRHLSSRGISVRCEFGDVSRLPPEMETALFRMCQEAMTNVARHAQATAVLVQVGVEGDAVVIEIEDDGKGFEPAGAARREGRRPWGLMGIGERAEILGGTARIDSAPGKGTRVLVRIPLPRAPEAPARAEVVS